MPANEYHFVTNWKIKATCEEVYRTLEDIDALSTWWPSVYLDVKVLQRGAPGGVGKVVDLYTKGWLPYTLRWRFRVTETYFPNGFALDAFGDLAGKGVWTFAQDGDNCFVTYDWKIDAEKPLLRYLSFMMRSIFSANHHWAMKKGEESLALELQRRRAKTAAERNSVPAPPQPTFRKKSVKSKSQ